MPSLATNPLAEAKVSARAQPLLAFRSRNSSGPRQITLEVLPVARRPARTHSPPRGTGDARAATLRCSWGAAPTIAASRRALPQSVQYGLGRWPDGERSAREGDFPAPIAVTR